MINYILIVLTALGYAVELALTKVYQLDRGNTMETGVVFNFILGFFGAIMYFVICGFKVEATAFSFVLALLFTVFFGTFTIIGFKIMSMGNVAVYTMFLMLGSIIMPYFYGLIFLDEQITIIKVIALIAMVAAIILQKEDGEKKGNTLFYILCIIVFILNGCVTIVSKMHQITERFETVSTNEFILLRNILQFVMFGAMIPFVTKNRKKAFFVSPKIYLLIIGITIVSNLAYMFQLICSSYLPATVLFPVSSGGTIIFSALIGLIFFKEVLNKKQITGLIICVISTVLFVI